MFISPYSDGSLIRRLLLSSSTKTLDQSTLRNTELAQGDRRACSTVLGTPRRFCFRPLKALAPSTRCRVNRQRRRYQNSSDDDAEFVSTSTSTSTGPPLRAQQRGEIVTRHVVHAPPRTDKGEWKARAVDEAMDVDIDGRYARRSASFPPAPGASAATFLLAARAAAVDALRGPIAERQLRASQPDVPASRRWGPASLSGFSAAAADVGVLAHGDPPDLQARSREEEERMPAREAMSAAADFGPFSSDARTPPPVALDPPPVRFIEPVEVVPLEYADRRITITTLFSSISALRSRTAREPESAAYPCGGGHVACACRARSSTEQAQLERAKEEEVVQERARERQKEEEREREQRDKDAQRTRFDKPPPVEPARDVPLTETPPAHAHLALREGAHAVDMTIGRLRCCRGRSLRFRTSRRRGRGRTTTTIWGWRVCRTRRRRSDDGVGSTRFFDEGSSSASHGVSSSASTHYRSNSNSTTSSARMRSEEAGTKEDPVAPITPLPTTTRFDLSGGPKARDGAGEKGTGGWPFPEEENGLVDVDAGREDDIAGDWVDPVPPAAAKKSKSASGKGKGKEKTENGSKTKKAAAVPVPSVHYLFPLSAEDGATGRGQQQQQQCAEERERERRRNVTVSPHRTAQGHGEGQRMQTARMRDGGRTQSGGVRGVLTTDD
ncbi:hypothetical protein C8J57DRAFT_1718089 [Mycena rebaudengoi]|nr:hypothetical protein C8J57DRAFT_1718089 [Mycena rebaudengoi]